MAPNPTAKPSPTAQPSPFDLNDDATYRAWREWKLAQVPTAPEALLVAIADPLQVTESEADAIRVRCRASNMALFRVEGGIGAPKRVLPHLAARFGMRTLDVNPYADDEGISALQALASGKGAEYIPYTNRRLSWHTDGYYNDAKHQVRGMALYCQRPAAEGGESLLLDHELVYLQLRDRDPELVAALMATDAMSIPGNDFDDTVSRGESSGPVFSVDAHSGALHMRYTARTRSIRWKDDAPTAAALQALQELINDDAPYVLRHRLQPGEGLLCNNVLHRRTGFEDEPGRPGRLVYRARYYERIDDAG